MTYRINENPSKLEDRFSSEIITLAKNKCIIYKDILDSEYRKHDFFAQPNYTQQNLFQKCCEVELDIIKFGLKIVKREEKKRVKNLPDISFISLEKELRKIADYDLQEIYKRKKRARCLFILLNIMILINLFLKML